MRVDKLQKMYKENFNKRDNFRHITDWLVEHYTVDVDDDRKRDASADAALGMALGEAMTKNSYLLKGATIGVVGLGLTLMIGNKIKKMREKKYMVWVTDNVHNTRYTIVEAVDEDTAKAKVLEDLNKLFKDEYEIVDIKLMD